MQSIGNIYIFNSLLVDVVFNFGTVLKFIYLHLSSKAQFRMDLSKSPYVEKFKKCLRHVHSFCLHPQFKTSKLFLLMKVGFFLFFFCFFFFTLNKIPSPGGKLITNLWSGGKFYSCFKPMKVGLILEVLTQPYPQCYRRGLYRCNKQLLCMCKNNERPCLKRVNVKC